MKKENLSKLTLTLNAVIIVLFVAMFGFIIVTLANSYNSSVSDADMSFGVLDVKVNYTDTTKQTSTFGLFDVSKRIVPDEPVRLGGVISGKKSDNNEVITNSNLNSYLRFKISLTAYEDKANSIPVDYDVQETLDAVANGVYIDQNCSNWAKGSDGYVYYVGGEYGDELKWDTSEISLAGEVLLMFPSANFDNEWQWRMVEISIDVEAFQYDSFSIDKLSCSTLDDKLNCASSLMLNYSKITGAPTNSLTISTANCTTSTAFFTKGSTVTSTIGGGVTNVLVYSAGKKLKSGQDYSFDASISRLTITKESGNTNASLYVVGVKE